MGCSYIEVDNKCTLTRNRDQLQALLVLCVSYPLGGLPFDGVPIEELVSVHISVTSVFVVLSTAGIAFAIFCTIFNITFRQKK